MDLSIGQTLLGKPFTLPEEALVETFAVVGIRGSGKTTLLAVLCEEFLKCALPWTMLDPVGVGWGLRAGKDGKPEGGLPVVVIGGPHGDLPLAKDQGRKIAEALLDNGPCSVIDLSRESKTTWRKFLTDFCLGSMECTGARPRHFFIEEAAEFTPQRTKVAVTAACKEAVERLVRLGRNQGFGCTLAAQRPATVDKDVLSQCENLIALRTVGKHDRKAYSEWLEPKWAEKMAADPKGAKAETNLLIGRLASMRDGQAYFWSPSWLRTFEQIQIRDRRTFHPGATRRDMRGGVKDVKLMDVERFVEKMKTKLTRTQVPVKPEPVRSFYNTPAPELKARRINVAPSAHPEIDRAGELEARNQLKTAQERIKLLEGRIEELANALRGKGDAERRLKAARELLQPQYDILRALFSDAMSGPTNGQGVPRAAYEPWFEKAAVKGCRRLLELLIDRGEMTQQQLATLAGVTPRTFRNYRAWFTRNQLVQLDGGWPNGKIKLVPVG